MTDNESLLNRGILDESHVEFEGLDHIEILNKIADFDQVRLPDGKLITGEQLARLFEIANERVVKGKNS